MYLVSCFLLKPRVSLSEDGVFNILVVIRVIAVRIYLTPATELLTEKKRGTV